ncbi:MAG: BACON domain-containing protein [Syntrophothermus sp.]
MASTITLGLAEIQVGVAAPNGTMPGGLTKIGKTYKDSCKLAQATADVTEHFEEGKGAPEVRKKQKKIPVLTFSIMDPDTQLLADYIGGSNTNGAWGFNGDEDVVNKSFRVKTEQGLWIDIPNGDIDAVINAEFSEKGIFLVDFTITPLAVTAGKAVQSYPGLALTVAPTTLAFTAAADAVGKTITATSTGNVTAASAPSSEEWLTVTKALKVVTVKVSANANSEPRTANVTIVADGIAAVVPVTQAGA